MRHRLEDLGRIHEKLEAMLELDVFDIIQGRTKDFPEDFRRMDPDDQDITLHNLAYGIKSIEERLNDCFIIARGMEDE